MLDVDDMDRPVPTTWQGSSADAANACMSEAFVTYHENSYLAAR